MKQQTSQKPSGNNARDREMGRDTEPRGDLGQQGKTWAPPAGAQGISNRPGDEGADGDDSAPDLDDDQGENEGEAQGSTTDYVAGGDKSNRAAHSGATGERHPGGGANKPEPKDQDEKGNAGSRNNTNRNR